MNTKPWKMTDSGFILQLRGDPSFSAEELEDTPIFLALCRENNGALFSQMRRSEWA